MTALSEKCKRIKIVLTDADGVLTDGGMYYSENGEIMKKFCVLDGMGVNLLRRNGIPTIIITKEKSKITKKWATMMKVKKIYQGIIEKELVLNDIYKRFNVTTKEIAYIGDDVNDVELLRKSGLALAPSNAVSEAKNVCDYICKRKGGQGAFREIVDLILKSKVGKIKYTLSSN